ncbi:CLUMA_CG016557, isoform A [Clunio marinus]|uniref:CLUMA_CG016557, isoform A n=1 Tax=Clunio marinus TaxID=568069 RepID=A0A1J1IU01_9DIPT|nr:CLUMA_CG016557, isoform A [Clunio marinus]
MKSILLLISTFRIISAIQMYDFLKEDAEIYIEDCAKKGELSRSCDDFNPKAFRDLPSDMMSLCKDAYLIKCIEKSDEIYCKEGEAAAIQGKDCKHLKSDTSQKCCNACKLGLNYKKLKIGCAFDSQIISNVSKGIVLKCCNVIEKKNFYDDYDDEYNEIDSFFSNEETKPFKIEYKSFIMKPEALTLTTSKPISCKEYNPCDENQICVENSDNYKCDCKPGFSADKNGNCHDIDECSKGLHNCSKQHRQCVNLEGSHKCGDCVSGYEKLYLDYDLYGDIDSICQDIDECATPGTCSDNQKCENLPGSHRCIVKCHHGFIMIDNKCVDIDECQDKKKCQWKCENNVGSYQCHCPLGYLRNSNGICSDIDECKLNRCRDDEICINIKGNYRCNKIKCPVNYQRFKNTTDCRLKVCKHLKCHRNYSFIFKAVTPTQRNKRIYQFFDHLSETNMPDEYFKIKKTKHGNDLIMMKAPQDDIEFELTLQSKASVDFMK